MRKLFLILMFVIAPATHGESSPPFTKQETAPNAEQRAQLQKQADSGDASAQVILGWMYYYGKGIPIDYAKAMEWYQKAAVQGNADAQFGIGLIYHTGKGVPKDATKAMEWYQKAASQGHAHAQATLGVMHHKGEGVQKDVAKAMEWYQKAAVQGHAIAQFNLGGMYYEGEGVLKDYAKAAKWFQNAAAQGDARAQYSLGVMYREGEGVPKDDAKAMELYQKAAAQGDARAQNNLGVMYYKGEGVPKDDTKALEWFQKAAAQGDAIAQYSLGLMYAKGEGVPEDRVLAYAWANLAAAQVGDAGELAKRLRGLITLSSAQRAKAERLSSNWKLGQVLRRERESTSGSDNAASAGGALTKKGTGTAFVVSTGGHAVTNHHVVDGCKEVRTQILAGKVAVTPVVARDPRNDLALVKLPSPVVGVATFRDGRTVRQGDSVVAVGFPLHGLLASGANLTTGTVSALAGLGDDTRFLQISAPVQPGNSGGPLLDLSGNVVGVVVSKLDAIRVAKAIGDIPQNVNFAINATVARGFLDAKGVKYETAPSNRKLEAADVGELAKKFTVVVECWK